MAAIPCGRRAAVLLGTGLGGLCLPGVAWGHHSGLAPGGPIALLGLAVLALWLLTVLTASVLRDRRKKARRKPDRHSGKDPHAP